MKAGMTFSLFCGELISAIKAKAEDSFSYGILVTDMSQEVRDWVQSGGGEFRLVVDDAGMGLSAEKVTMAYEAARDNYLKGMAAYHQGDFDLSDVKRDMTLDGGKTSVAFYDLCEEVGMAMGAIPIGRSLGRFTLVVSSPKGDAHELQVAACNYIQRALGKKLGVCTNTVLS